MPRHTAPSPALGALLLTLIATPVFAACPPVTLFPPVHYGTGQGPVEVVAEDFTGDGIPDLVVSASAYPDGPGAIDVLPGLAPGGIPDGTFGPRVSTLVGGVPLGLAATDLDADGHMDLIVGNWGLNAVQVLRGLGNGSFAAPLTLPAGAKPYEVVTGDFNSDGVTDIAVADNAENNVQVLLGGNDGAGHWNGSFAAAVAYATQNLPLSITAGDFNQDGIADLAATEYFSSTVAVFLGNGTAGAGDGTFAAALHVSAGSEPYDLATGDFNEDGKLDLAVAVGNSGGVLVLLGSGTGSFPVSNSYVAGSNCSGVSVADLDGDGISDLVSTTSLGNQLLLLRGLGLDGVGNGTFDAPVTISNCCFPVHAITTDLDLDGRPDVVTCNYTSNQVAVFLDGCAPNPALPHITRIRDVPNDQGGKVYITWTRSSLDVSGGAVNSYIVWRQVPSGVAAARAMPSWEGLESSLRAEVVTRSNGTTEIVYWEALATLPAQRLAGYGYTAATPQDSLRGSNPLSTFYISALTSNIDVHYDSNPDSGYSVDNLGPGRPGGFAVQRNLGSAQLIWDASPEADLECYRLYRSYEASFTPSEATLLATLTTPGYTDPEGGLASYQLAAVDKHGNSSPYAADLAPTTGVTPGGVAGRTGLDAPAPNPMREALDVTFALGRPSRVSLALFDQQGRLVRTLVNGERPAGETSLRWDARDAAGHAAAAGLYFLEMRAEGRRFVRRVIVVR